MAAIGHANPNPLPIRGPLWFDAREFGLSTKNADNAPALQAAHDAAVAAIAAWPAGQTPLATVFIPGAKGTYFVKSPIYVDGSQVEFRGEGQGVAHSSRIAMASGLSYPVFALGIPRTAGGPTPGTTYRPDLFGKLDTSAASASGRRWGVRTNGDLYLLSHGSSLTHGGASLILGSNAASYYREQPYLTIDFAIEGFPSGVSGVVPATTVAGLGTSTTPVPWLLTTSGGGNYTLNLGFQTAQFGPVTKNAYTFSIGATTGLRRVSIQVDLVALAVTAWADGIQVAVAGAAPAAGSAFNEQEISAFGINSGAAQSFLNSTGADWALYGLAVSSNLKYAVNGVGTAQVANPWINSRNQLLLPTSPTGGTFTIAYKGQTTAPISATASAATIQAALQALSTIGAGNVTVTATGTAQFFNIAGANGFTFTAAPGMCNGSLLTGGVINDAFRVFPAASPVATWDSYTFGYLPLTENPATAPRHLSVAGDGAAGNSTCSAFLINGGTLNSALAGVNAVEDRFVNIDVAGGGAYGAAILVGDVLQTRYEGCKIAGALWAVADIPIQANYLITFKDCVLTGFDAAYLGVSSLAQMDSVTFPNNGRSTLRLFGGDMDARHLFVTAPGGPQYAFCSLYSELYGGVYTFSDVTIDNEGAPLLRGVFYAEDSPVNMLLTVNNLYYGLPGGCPIFLLKGLGSTVPAALKASYVLGDNVGPLVSVDGPGWVGEVTNSSVDLGPDVVNTAAFPGRPRVRVVHEGTPSVPKYGSSLARCTRLRNAGAADGQFDVLTPAADGVWGTATPPKWAGLDLLQADPAASLAAYGVDHTAIAASLSGQSSSFGHLTTFASTQFAATLFPGSASGAVPGTEFFLTVTGATGGTYTVSFGGQTTTPLAWNSTALQVQTALRALSSLTSAGVILSGAPNPYNVTLTGSLASLAGGSLGFTADATGLTGTSPTVTFVPLAGPPSTWYVGLSAGNASRSGVVSEPAGSTGYARVALANSSAGFTAASAGSKASAAAVTFPAVAAGKTCTIRSIFLADAPTGGHVWATIQLAQPITFTAGQTPTIPSGGLTFMHTPIGGMHGTLTDFGWGKLYDLAFRGATFSVPPTWFPALSTAPVTKATTSLTEPAAGYARASVANTPSNWTNAVQFAQAGDAGNIAAVAFPAPTGPWGPIVAVALADAGSAGNVWMGGPLAAPVSPTTGTAAPTFAAGAFLYGL